MALGWALGAVEALVAASYTPSVLGKAWFDSADLTVFLSRSQDLAQIGPITAGAQIKSAMDVLPQSATWDVALQSLVMSQWDVSHCRYTVTGKKRK